jgi:hypothetical protein
LASLLYERLGEHQHQKRSHQASLPSKVFLMSFKSGCKSLTIQFMTKKLLNSQLYTLEEPANDMSVDVSEPPQVFVENIRTII